MTKRGTAAAITIALTASAAPLPPIPDTEDVDLSRDEPRGLLIHLHCCDKAITATARTLKKQLKSFSAPNHTNWRTQIVWHPRLCAGTPILPHLVPERPWPSSREFLIIQPWCYFQLEQPPHI
jgi:hypothetical protein